MALNNAHPARHTTVACAVLLVVQRRRNPSQGPPAGAGQDGGRTSQLSEPASVKPGRHYTLGLVSRHSLWNASQGSWKSLHRLILVDIAHLCEGNLLWKACAGKKAVWPIACKRIKCMFLLAGEADVCALFHGRNSKCSDLISQHLKDLFTDDAQICKHTWFERALHLTFDSDEAGAMIPAAGAFSSSDMEKLTLVSRNNFKLLKKRKRC